MGTSIAKLKEMAALADTISDSLVGDRPEIARVRTRMRQLIQDVRVSGKSAQPASTALRRMADGLRKVSALVAHRLVDVPDEFEVESFSVLNTWGYSIVEMATAGKALGDAARRLRKGGLPELSKCIVQLDPRLAAAFVTYRRDNDTLAMDLSRTGGAWDVYYALGARLWRGFREKERELWGGSTGDERFQTAFADLMDESKKPSRDVLARLQLSIGGA